MRKNLILFTIIILLTNCTPLLYRKKIDEKIQDIPESSKVLDIPKYDNGKPYIYWHLCKQKESVLGLESPETSTDSLIIRIWSTLPTRKISQRQDFIEIRNSNNSWKAQVINMSVDVDNREIEEKITNFIKTDVVPKTNWESLIDSLFILKVDKLPTDEQLPNYKENSTNYSNNTPTFCFEYATPNHYRFYQYNNVIQLETKYWQAKNVLLILDKIDREFKVDSLAYDFYLKKLKTE